MITILVYVEPLSTPIEIECKADIDITDKRFALLLAKSIVETVDNVEDTINTVTTDCMDMMIEITEPQVKERKSMFYSDN